MNEKKIDIDQYNEQYKESQFYDILERKHRGLPKKQLEKKLKLEEEIGLVDTLKDIKEQLIKETKEIYASVYTNQSIDNYFAIIEKQIEKRIHYKNSNHKLDYLLIHRFLWTTLNNLNDIDIQIITPEIRKLSKNLKNMEKTYKDFAKKIQYPSLAYEEVFLSSQSEYKELYKNNEKIVEEMRKLKMSEEYLAASLTKRKNLLKKTTDPQKRKEIQTEYRIINGTYVDVIHIISVLKERYNENQLVIQSFKNKYFEEFNTLFSKTATIYEKILIDILGAQAFELDMLLWEQAEKSKNVQQYFKEAGINGEFNTKTYLQYYLESNKHEKETTHYQKLYELYEYLQRIYIKHIVIVTNSTDDAIEFKKSIKSITKEHKVHSFIHEKEALKFALQNIVDILIVNEELNSMSSSSFLKYYQKYSLHNSKLIFLGYQQDKSYEAIQTLSTEITPNFLANTIKKLL